MVTKKTSTSNKKQKSILGELTRMTKNTLYNFAKKLGIPGRSSMNKSELVEILDKNKDKVKTLITSSPKEEIPQKTVQRIDPMKNKEIPNKTEKIPEKTSKLPEMPSEKREMATEAKTSSHADILPPREPVHEAGQVWAGEEGPELPQKYGITVLRALVRDPHWAYVYWEISEKARESLCRKEGEWIFDVSEPYLRAYDEHNVLVKEIPVLLDAMNWYVSLPANRMYGFQLGIKNREGDFRVLAESNKVSMPQEQPSQVQDEEWAMVEDKFEEMLESSGGLDLSLWSGSSEGMPRVLRHRIRMPWTIPSHEWPSSHLMGISSPALQKK